MILLKSNIIFTATEKEPISGAIAVTDNRIVAVGRMEEIIELCGEIAQIIDFGDRLIVQ